MEKKSFLIRDILGGGGGVTVGSDCGDNATKSSCDDPNKSYTTGRTLGVGSDDQRLMKGQYDRFPTRVTYERKDTYKIPTSIALPGQTCNRIKPTVHKSSPGLPVATRIYTKPSTVNGPFLTGYQANIKPAFPHMHSKLHWDVAPINYITNGILGTSIEYGKCD